MTASTPAFEDEREACPRCGRDWLHCYCDTLHTGCLMCGHYTKPVGDAPVSLHGELHHASCPLLVDR